MVQHTFTNGIVMGSWVTTVRVVGVGAPSVNTVASRFAASNSETKTNHVDSILRTRWLWGESADRVEHTFFSSAIFKFLRGLPHADIELAYPKILDIGPKLIQFCMLRRISTFPFYKYVPVVSVVLLSISFVVICLFAQTPLWPAVTKPDRKIWEGGPYKGIQGRKIIMLQDLLFIALN